MWFIGAIRSTFKYFILILTVCFFSGILYYGNNPVTARQPDHVIYLFICLILFFICIFYCFLCRYHTKKYAEMFKHPEYFNPTKKYEHTFFNFYFGIDYKTGNMLYIDRFRYRAVMIEWGTWKRYYGNASGLIVEFWDMERDNLIMRMAWPKLVRIKIDRVRDIKHKLRLTSRGEWAKHVPEPMIKE